MTRITWVGLVCYMLLSLTAAAQLPRIVPRTGLVAYHDFNGTFESRIAGKNRFKNNGVVFETHTANGRESISARFNGQPREAVYLEADDPATFRSNTYTYAVRFKVNEFRPLNSGGFNYYHQALLAFCPPSWKWGAAYSLALNQLDNSVLNAGQWTPSRPYFTSTPYRTIWLDRWYTAAVTYDGTTMKLYFEGKLIDERLANLDYSNQSSFIIGGAKDGPDGKVMGGFSGNIDDFAFWNRALSSDEVSRVHRGLQQASLECRQQISVANISIDATSETVDSVILKEGATYLINGSGTWTPNGGYSKVDCEWEYFEPCAVRGPAGGLRMGFEISKIEQNQEVLQPVESSIQCNTHQYTYVVRGTGKPLYIVFRDQPVSDNGGRLEISIDECITCSAKQPSDSLLGYRKVETHQVATYALRNKPSNTYEWIVSGGYLLGSNTNHYCDVIWGFDVAGSVCCVVRDSSCNDTVCVSTEISEPNSVNVSEDVERKRIEIRPNPASDAVDIVSFDVGLGATFELVDVTGKLVLTTDSDSRTISLAGLSDGVYHLVYRALSGQIMAVERLVVRR